MFDVRMFANNRILKFSKVRMFAKFQKLICSEVRMFVCSNVQVFHVWVLGIWNIIYYDWCAVEFCSDRDYEFISTAQIKLTDIFWTPFYRINEMTQSSCLYSPIVDGLGQLSSHLSQSRRFRTILDGLFSLSVRSEWIEG